MSTTSTETRPTRQSSNPDHHIPTRRVSFDEGLATLPRHFAADGDLMTSHLFAGLSALFPEGEDFFVRSVRHYRDRITDPELKRQVAGFIGQESVHGREHRAFNARLAELGYPTRAFDRLVRLIFTSPLRKRTPMLNLAITAAIEHFTAVLAELILTDPEARRLAGGDVMTELFVWHALEESEHKAVAFDVYRAVGGNERLRQLAMRGVRIGFVTVMCIQMLVSLSRDPAARRRGALRASWKRFKHCPLARRANWDALCEYDRRGFHPDDRDTTELVEQWREQLFGNQGSLNRLLAGNGSVTDGVPNDVSA